MIKKSKITDYDSLKDFTSVTAHQLRSPLSSLRWLIKMLIDGEEGSLNKAQQEIAKKSYELLEHLVLMVNFLLQIGRVESGRLKVAPEPISLTAFIGEVLEVLKPQIEQKRLKFSFKVKSPILTTVLADKELLWQVLQNLLVNSINYSSRGDKIEINIKRKDKVFECSVKDSGIGIPKEDQPKIFDKFFRARNAVKILPTGTGLGLPLVKVLVELWGGEVWFNSKEKKGTTFYFTLPVSGMKAKIGEVNLNV